MYVVNYMFGKMSCLYFLVFLNSVLGVSLKNLNNFDGELEQDTISFNSLAELSDDENSHENLNETSSFKDLKPAPLLWKESTVLYNFSSVEDIGVSEATKHIVRRSIKYLQRFSCLKFKQISTEEEDNKAHLYFMTQNNSQLGNCWSNTGRMEEEGPYSIGVSCECDRGIVTHLIIRALGIIDEHQRSDRDEYVKFLPENFVDEAKYDKASEKRENNMFFKFPYDYNSITHLGSTEYTKPGENKPTIEAKTGNITFQEKYGRSLSILDVVKINAAFGCFNTTAETFSPKHMKIKLF